MCGGMNMQCAPKASGATAATTTKTSSSSSNPSTTITRRYGSQAVQLSLGKHSFT